MARTVGIAIALLVIFSIWIPLFSHYHITAPTIDSPTLQRSRSNPTDTVLAEIGKYKHKLVPPLGMDLKDPIGTAEHILQRNGTTCSAKMGKTGLFDPQCLIDLEYASFGVPRTLLAAYEASGREKYLDAARRFILAWADYERRVWLPNGLLWNDHAVAVRSVAMSEFWRHYRHSPQYDERQAKNFLSLVSATALRLANPAYYTYASNHGTMQNLGLLHLSLAFPELPNSAAFADLAIRRQQEQITYIFSPEGVWLEHSAGYHELGMELLGIYLRYMTLLGKDIPPGVWDTYLKARSVYTQLRTSAGSLPRIGDTTESSRYVEPLTTGVDETGRAVPMVRMVPADHPQSNALYVDAGYAIWWSGVNQACQLTVSWSNYARHGHKHADELSLNLRNSDGRWWTSVGYWPLTHHLRKKAQSWAGSNAPHLQNEPENSARRSLLRGYAWTDNVAAIDLERRGPDRFRTRRQIIHVHPGLWVVLDAFGGEPARTVRVVWGTEYDVAVTPGRFDNTYTLTKDGARTDFFVHFLTNTRTSAVVLRGSEDPFAGWVEVEYSPVPAYAFVLETPANESWITNTTLSSASGFALAGPTRMVRWTGPEQWRLEIPTTHAIIGMQRAGATISITKGPTDSPLALLLSSASARSNDAIQGDAAYAAAAATYGPRFRGFLHWRWRATFLLFALLIAQELILWWLRHVHPPRASQLGLVSTVLWVGIGVWLHTKYLLPN